MEREWTVKASEKKVSFDHCAVKKGRGAGGGGGGKEERRGRADLYKGHLFYS